MAQLMVFLLILISPLRAQESNKKMDSLFLNLSKVTLGPVNSADEKKAIYTIDLEESQITRTMLKEVYKNAFDLYKKGDFSGAKQLTKQILNIDPDFQDAQILQKAAIELKGSPRPLFSEHKFAEDKFEEGMSLYREGRLVEAANRLQEVVKLSPYNLRAAYWLKKCHLRLAHQHFVRGRIYYEKHNYRKALDQWYSALVLNPRYPHLQEAIQRVELQAKNRDMNTKLEAALTLYSEGQTTQALQILDGVLAYEPTNRKVRRLMGQIRAEMASQHVADGRELYRQGHFNQAITQWKRATDYGYDTEAADQLIARAKEAIRNQAQERRRAVDLAQKRKEAALAAAKDKAAEKLKEKTAQASASVSQTTSAQSSPSESSSPVPLQTGAVSEDAKKSSEQHYLSGVIYYEKSDYQQARNEWVLAKQLNPENSDAAAGLEKIDKLYNNGGL